MVEIIDRERRIENAVGKLPEYQRAMIVMYHAEMMSYEEISATLGIKLGTVRSRIHRGRAQLREALAHRAPREAVGIAARPNIPDRMPPPAGMASQNGIPSFVTSNAEV